MRTQVALSQRRRLARQSNQIIETAREARKALVHVIDLVSARSTEVLGLDEAGDPIFERQKLTEQERIDRLGMSLTWLQKAEEFNRQLRAAIERALEREWKSL